MTTIKNSSMVVDQTVKKIFINKDVMRIDVYTITPPVKMYKVIVDGENIDFLNPTLVAEERSALLTLKSSPRHTIASYSVFGVDVDDSYIYDYDQALNILVRDVMDDIVVKVETEDLQYYPINFKLFGCTADPNNPTELAVSARPIKFYFTSPEGSKFADSIYVDGASYSWKPENGELTLWSAKGPEVSVDVVTIPIRWLAPIQIETAGCYSDENNPTEAWSDDVDVVLKFTEMEGYKFEDAIAVSGASYTWNTDTGELILHKIEGSPVRVFAVAYLEVYSIPITVSTIDCIADQNNPTEVLSTEEKVVLKFSPTETCDLPDSIIVSGADYDWDNITGELTLTNFSTAISVRIVGQIKVKTYTIKTTAISCTADPNNPTSALSTDENTVLKFTASSGYKLPTSITVSGADYTWNSTTGEVILTKLHGNVTVQVIGTATGQAYKITQTLIGCTADPSNPTSIVKGERITLKFTPTSGSFSSSINVSGAQYIWDYANGELTLYNAYGNVNIFIFAF